MRNRRSGLWLPSDTMDPDGLSRFRTVWISDLHLGSRGADVGRLLEFLSSIECNHLFLVGALWMGGHSNAPGSGMKLTMR